jgi:hypothetical protein
MRTVNLRQSYRFYQKHVEEPVDIKIYLEIVHGFLKFIMQKIFDGKDVKLPCELGAIGVRGKKIKPYIGTDGEIKGLSPNWRKTKELWDKDEKAKLEKKIVFDFNEHTSGFRYKIIWWKKRMKFKNKMVYSLRFSRPNKRALHKLIKQGREYPEYQA